MSTATSLEIAPSEHGASPAESEPSESGQLAWRGLLRAHACLSKRLDAELEQAHGLPLSSYEVLDRLAESSGGRMRMCDLAEQAQLSRSGLTRLVDRLERERPARALLLRTRRARLVRVPDAERARTAARRRASRTSASCASSSSRASPSDELAALADMWQRIAPCAGADAPGC